MNNWEQAMVGSAVIVYSKRLNEPNHSKIDEIFIVNKQTFSHYLNTDESFMNPDNRLCVLRYGEDHIIILEHVFSNVLEGTDFNEYKVLTKTGIGYILLNKMHEFLVKMA